MLNQYKNIREIESATQSVTGERIDVSKLGVLSYREQRVTPVPEIVALDTEKSIEVHVYSEDTWITGNHTIALQNKVPEFRDPVTNELITLPHVPVAVDLFGELNKLKLTAGSFRFVVNFFQNLIGDYNRQHLRIDEISPDRTEIRLRAIDSDDAEFLYQITNYIDTVNHTTSRYFNTYLLNFSRNNTVQFVNSVVIGDYVYVKLLDPLSEDITVDFKCWIVEELKPPYIDRVFVAPSIRDLGINRLANPNWYANAEFNTSTETGFQAWTDLLGTTVKTSQQIVDTYFSGSLSGIPLNIDYSDFNNFVFYSSARERLDNFVYKLNLIEYYASQKTAVTQLSGSVATTNAADYELSITNLISGFDGFEQYLYYQSGSRLTTHPIPNETWQVEAVTGSYVQPVPKTTTTRPYSLASISSSAFSTWYDTTLEWAVSYDKQNPNALHYNIPEFIKLDASNEGIDTFVNMLGHHYDILYTYVNHMSKINKREENPRLGMPNELLYSAARQFGWNLQDGNQRLDLWDYILGTDSEGIPLTGSLTIGDPAVSGQNRTYAVWRRIVNNLPLLLKSKGTKRSIQALLSCYGIPQSIISIKEYGGPRIDRTPIYEKLNFGYSLDLLGTTAGVVEVPYSGSVGSVELTFRLDDVLKTPTMPSSMELLNINSGSFWVTVDFSSGTRGTVSINGGSSSTPIEMFDGGWLSILITTDGTDTTATVKRAKYGKIVATTTVTEAGVTIPSNGVLLLGASTNSTRLSGQIQELRLWKNELSETYFINHVKAPGAYNSADPYSELLFRLPLSEKINHAVTSSLYGAQPVPTTFTASAYGWSTATPYDALEQTWYYDSISIGAGTYDDNKVRLEANELVGSLDLKTRAERSQYDSEILDSNKLGVYFSPQSMIDEDVIAQYGFISLDDYIGDPGDINADSYPALQQKAQQYWKKYSNRGNINDYIKVFSLYDLSFFKQLTQLIPARVDRLTGVLIQPNILERNRTQTLPQLSQEDVTYLATIADTVPNTLADYLTITGSIESKILDLAAILDQEATAYLTASAAKKYDGMVYSHTSIIRSASMWITASTPYWISEAVAPVVVESVKSEYQYISGSISKISESIGFIVGSVYGTSTYGTSIYGSGSSVYRLVSSGAFSQASDYAPRGVANHRWLGCKLTSPGFNIATTQTVDGGPVVEWKTTNPNQLIYQSNGEDGSFTLL